MKVLLVFAFATCAFAVPINRTECEVTTIEGNAASPGQYPYQASVKYFDQHICGGSIIDQHTILSAAHCIDGKPIESLSIMTGCLHIDKGGDSYAVSRYIPYTKYNPVLITDDVVIIKVTTVISYTLYVRPIFLNDRIVPPGSKGVFTGWGNSSQPGAVSNDLLHVRGDIIDQEECQNYFLTSNETISDNQICAISKYNKGHCLADSGGPLVHNQKQIGISSWLAECGIGRPDVYSRISFYYDWIKTYQ